MSFTQKRHSLKWRLIISFFLLVIIPTTTIGIYSYISSYRAIEAKIGVYSYQIMLQTINNLDRILSNVEDISLQIVSTRSIQNLLEKVKSADEVELTSIDSDLNNLLKNTISSRNEIIGANILMKDIDYVFVFGEPLIDISRYKYSDLYNTALQEDGRPFWVSTYENINPVVTYTNVTTFARKIIDVNTGEELGVLLLGVKEFAIADTYSYLDLGPNGFTFIVDREGRVVSDLNKRKLTEFSGYPFVYSIITDTMMKSVFSEYIEKEKVLVTYAKSNKASWFMISVVPYQYLIKEIEETGRLTLRLGLLFLGTALIIGLIISYSVFRPIEELEKDMQKIENGDLTVRTHVSGRNEIAKLAQGFNTMIDRIEKLITRNYETQLMKQEAQISALQSQINPHFLYNTLAVIDGMALKNSQRDIAEVSQLLADIFRYSTSGTEMATIEEELLQTKKYLQIQKYRKGTKLSFDIMKFDGVKDNLLPKLIIQPIVENAIVHGIDKKRAGGHIIIEIKANKDKILIIINDNGVGMDDETLDRLRNSMKEKENMEHYWSNKVSHHIGLINVNNRIKSYYGDDFGIEIISKKNYGTYIEISIPRCDIDFT